MLFKPIYWQESHHVESTVAYNLNHNTAGPDGAFASSWSEPLGFYQAEFHNQQATGKTQNKLISKAATNKSC